MDAQIALALVHPYTREAVSFATRTLHSDNPQWIRDPELQTVLWDFAAKVAEYALVQPSMLVPLANAALLQERQTLYTYLPAIQQWIEGTVNYLSVTFPELPGLEGGARVELSIYRIVYFTAIVAQAQRTGIDPQRFLEK